jgi:hypothetical protein
VPYVVFAQLEGARLPLNRLASQAEAHFAAVVRDVTPHGETRARFEYSAHDERSEFSVSIRAIADSDVAAARAVDQGGGLADLAARCKTIWVVESPPTAPEWLALECSALLASIALGPIFDADGGLLLGVRSARERADRIRGGPPLMR